MAVEYQDKTEVKTSDGGITLPIPVGFSAGDLLIACITKDDDDAITPPAGDLWTVIENLPAGTAARLWTGYRIAEADDTNWTWTGDKEGYYGVILRYKGHSDTPIKAHGSDSGSSKYPIAPSVAFENLAAGSLVLQVFGADDDTPYTMASGLEERFRDAQGTTGGAGGDRAVFPYWISPTGFLDPDTEWTNEVLAYDEDTTKYANQQSVPATSWGSWLELTIDAISCSKVRFWAGYDVDRITQIDIEVKYDDGEGGGLIYHPLYIGSFAPEEWVEKEIGSTQTVTAMRMKFYNTSDGTSIAKVYEADFWELEGVTGNTGTAKFSMNAIEEWAAVTVVIEAAVAAGDYKYIGNGVFIYSGKAFHRWGDWAEIEKEEGDWNRVEKEISNFVGIDKKDANWSKSDKIYMGWLVNGWLIYGWLIVLWGKVTKSISNWNEVSKE